jgi:hypothetical protein
MLSYVYLNYVGLGTVIAPQAGTCPRAAWQWVVLAILEGTSMKTLILAAIRCSLLFLVPSVTYAISAQWNLDPISGDWSHNRVRPFPLNK